MILVIVAAILALVALSRLNNVAANVAATMTEAVLSKVDLPAKDALANLRNLATEVRALDNTLREIRSGDHSIIQVEIARLNETLTGLNTSVDRGRRKLTSPMKQWCGWVRPSPTRC
jgi:peptidoglycan hydrolase CwlO-like protein